jgi:hypothetical protein
MFVRPKHVFGLHAQGHFRGVHGCRTTKQSALDPEGQKHPSHRSPHVFCAPQGDWAWVLVPKLSKLVAISRHPASLDFLLCWRLFTAGHGNSAGFGAAEKEKSELHTRTCIKSCNHFYNVLKGKHLPVKV